MKKIFFIILLVLIIPINAYAHKPSDSYITLKRDGLNIIGKWDIAIIDLNYVFSLDSDLNGEITWGEVKNAKQKIIDYAFNRFSISLGEEKCKFELKDFLIEDHSDGHYISLLFYVLFPENKIKTVFDIKYNLLFDLDSQHRGILQIIHKERLITTIFSKDHKNEHFDLDSNNLIKTFIRFLREGIWHIWIGFDHILFLLSLLLTSVLIYKGNVLIPERSFKVALFNLVKIVTAFTISHSFTLAIATLKIVQLDSRFIESAIALSIMIASFKNILNFSKFKNWVVAFFFGLIHGFGFSSVLLDLGLNEKNIFIPLLSFNIGVELGQLAIVAFIFPILFYLKDNKNYKLFILNAGSVIIFIISFIWFIERAFNFSIITN